MCLTSCSRSNGFWQSTPCLYWVVWIGRTSLNLRFSGGGVWLKTSYGFQLPTCLIAVRFCSGLVINDFQRVKLIFRWSQMRSNCLDGAKVGANFEYNAVEKVTIALFLGVLLGQGENVRQDGLCLQFYCRWLLEINWPNCWPQRRKKSLTWYYCYNGKYTNFFQLKLWLFNHLKLGCSHAPWSP